MISSVTERINGWGSRFGWGVVVSAAPFVNAVTVVTAGLGCYALVLLFSLFGVYPASPADSSNPISWALYLLIGICYGWLVWSQILFFFLLPLGLAWSLADLLIARARRDMDRAAGAAAGLALAIIPLVLYFQCGSNPAWNQCVSFPAPPSMAAAPHTLFSMDSITLRLPFLR